MLVTEPVINAKDSMKVFPINSSKWIR
jgi:hypothetical protein